MRSVGYTNEEADVMRRPTITPTLVTVALIVAWLLLAFGADRALAASSKGCVGSGFRLVMPNGQTIAGEQRGTVPAATLGQQFLVKGRYVEFTVRSDTFEVLDYTMTGAPNVLDMTGGRRTPVFAAKTPDLQGARLAGAMSLRLRDDRVELERDGGSVAMKIQAKDCAQGGIFQMEPEREDGGPTRITHTLAAGVFYFDNPFFRARIGQVLNGVTVGARVNFANDVSPNFVGRDSPQVAEKLVQTGRTTRVERGERRAHGRRAGRGRRRGRAAGHGVRGGLPGAEPGPRPLRRPRLPVPRPGREPADGRRDAGGLSATR